LFGASAAQAAPLFSDNFDTDTLGLNSIAFNGGWSVSGGTVDIIGAPGFFDLVPGNGRYIDLDGSTNKAGIFANSINVVNGMTYALSFDLAAITVPQAWTRWWSISAAVARPTRWPIRPASRLLP
jgi:hypothetical protein